VGLYSEWCRRQFELMDTAHTLPPAQPEDEATLYDRLHGLHDALAVAHQEKRDLRLQLAEARADCARAIGDKDRLERVVAEAKDARIVAEKEAGALRILLDAAKEGMNKAEFEAASLRVLRDNLVNELNERYSQIDAYSRETRRFESERDAAVKEAEELRLRHERQSQAITQYQGVAKSLTAERDAALAEVERLKDSAPFATIEKLSKDVERLRAGVDCHAARPGETTYECDVTAPCPACRLRAAEAEVERLHQWVNANRYGASLPYDVIDAAIAIAEKREHQVDTLQAEVEHLTLRWTSEPTVDGVYMRKAPGMCPHLVSIKHITPGEVWSDSLWCGPLVIHEADSPAPGAQP
jgi:chromosome segregation ATPase